MLRILHTSDWHIGAHFHGVSRSADHAAFFEWLVAAVDEHAVDALIVAGDVFDRAQPSNESLALYYDLLIALRDTGLRKIVVLGGNHDSPSQLDAPEQLLGRLDVHVVGGLQRERLSRHIIPLQDRDGITAAAVVAMPYVHEWQLGVRGAGKAPGELRRDMASAFRELHTELCDIAHERHAGAAIVGTGHLTVEGDGLQDGDAPREIHFVGKIAGLPADIFDPRMRYVALGHIHRPMPAGGGRAWYCGTPIPFGHGEMAVGRRALLVEVAGSDAPLRPTPLPIPLHRALVQLEGSLAQVAEAIAALSWDEPAPPLVSARLHVDEHVPGANDQLQQVLDAKFSSGDRPALAHVRQIARVADNADPTVHYDVTALSPMRVFELLCERAAPAVMDDELREAFATAQAEAERTT